MHAEDTVNVGLVPNTYLYMGLAAKPRVGVYVFPLREDAANGIERLFGSSFPCKVEEIDDGAVELAKAKIIAADILRHLGAGSGNDRLKTCVCRFHGMDTIGTDEVQAEPGVDHGADNEWLDFPAFLFQNSVGVLLGPFESSIRIGLPKIDSRSEPVVGVLAWAERLVQEQPFTRLLVTAVIPKNKGCR